MDENRSVGVHLARDSNSSDDEAAGDLDFTAMGNKKQLLPKSTGLAELDTVPAFYWEMISYLGKD